MKKTTLVREFHYNGTVLPDPNPAATVERAVALLAAAGHPELTNPKIEPATITGDKQIYNLRVALGDKG